MKFYHSKLHGWSLEHVSVCPFVYFFYLILQSQFYYQKYTHWLKETYILGYTKIKSVITRRNCSVSGRLKCLRIRACIPLPNHLYQHHMHSHSTAISSSNIHRHIYIVDRHAFLSIHPFIQQEVWMDIIAVPLVGASTRVSYKINNGMASSISRVTGEGKRKYELKKWYHKGQCFQLLSVDNN